MPKLKITQEQILADIKAGSSFVKVLPNNIGEIVYFDTDTVTGINKYSEIGIVSAVKMESRIQ